MAIGRGGPGLRDADDEGARSVARRAARHLSPDRRPRASSGGMSPHGLLRRLRSVLSRRPGPRNSSCPIVPLRAGDGRAEGPTSLHLGSFEPRWPDGAGPRRQGPSPSQARAAAWAQGLSAWPTPSEMTDRHDTVLSGGHLGQTRPLGGERPGVHGGPTRVGIGRRPSRSGLVPEDSSQEDPVART